MGRRGVALNTSIIKIGDMSAYYNTNQININNSISIGGNVSITENVNINSSDEPVENNNVTYSTETYTFDSIINNKISVNSNELTEMNLYIGNNYIFDQINNTLPDQLIIISKKKLQYNRSTGIIERDPYENGVTYSEDNITYNNFDSSQRKYLKFSPIERGTYYIVSKNKNTQLKIITLKVLDNVYNYSPFSTNSGASISKNLNVLGNMNVKKGMFYVLNDSENLQSKCVGINTTTPTYGLDFTNLQSYTDAIIVPTTVGTASNEGEKGMIRYNTELQSIQGYVNTEWENLGGVKDRDKDTYINPSIPGRNNEIDFYTNGFNRMTITDDELTRIGIGTTLPTATLEIIGNFNVEPSNNQSGIIFGNDESDNDRYLNIELQNDSSNSSIEIMGNSNRIYDIATNKTNTMNNKIYNSNNYSETISGFSKTTVDGNIISQNNSDYNITTSGTYVRTIEGTSTETIHADKVLSVKNSSTETYNSDFNEKCDKHIYETKHKSYNLYVNGDTIETYENNKSMTISNNITTNIGSNHLFINDGDNIETYDANTTIDISEYKTQTIKNNNTTFINSTYDINVKSNLTETYLGNVSRNTVSNTVLEINGNNTNLSNNNIKTIDSNLDTTIDGDVTIDLSKNKTTKIDGNFTEVVHLNALKNNEGNNIKTVNGAYNYNLEQSYVYNANNRDIYSLSNLVSTIDGKNTKKVASSTQNYEKNVTVATDKSSNKIIYNKYNKNIDGNVVEVYNNSKKIQSILSGHPLSGSNTLPYEIESTDLVVTNYVKIVQTSVYNNTINDYPYFYVFPGDGDDTLDSGLTINDWFVFTPGSLPNSWIITNSYNADTYDFNNDGNNDIGEEYVVLGPDESDNYSIILKDNYDANTTYNYTYKLVIGPRKHQLEYKLTTHFIKIFMIGSINTNVSLIKLTNNTVQAIQTHPNISHVGTSDYRFNNNDSVNTTYPNTNELNRFIFVYIENSQEKTGNIITKSKYYIYNQEESKYLKNKGNGTIDTVAIASNALDSTFEWTIETVNKADSTSNTDVYYIYNNNEYLQIDLNDSTITLTTKNENNSRQHFTLYYFNNHQVSVNSSLLIYNNESRIDYLTKNYKKIYINGDTNQYLSEEFNGSNENKIGTGVLSPFLLIYNNVDTVSESGTSIETFKIYSANIEEYLFKDSSINWIIESVDETGGTHVSAKHIIKKYENGLATKWLYNNNGNLALKNISADIPNDVMFTFEDTSTGINPGTLSQNIGNSSSKHTFNTMDISIEGNLTETYKAHLNEKTSGNYINTINGSYTVNTSNNSLFQCNSNSITHIVNNVSKTIGNKQSIYIHKNSTATYKANFTRFTKGNVNFKVRDL